MRFMRPGIDAVDKREQNQIPFVNALEKSNILF
jgi:hypothetical protein